jgi:hypothetical protein
MLTGAECPFVFSDYDWQGYGRDQDAYHVDSAAVACMIQGISSPSDQDISYG